MQSPWFNSDRCDFSILHGQAHDGLFFSHFFKVFCWNLKSHKIVKVLTFYLLDLHYFRVHENRIRALVKLQNAK